MSISVHICPMFSVRCESVGKLSRHKPELFVMLRFPDLGAESTGVLPRPNLNQ